MPDINLNSGEKRLKAAAKTIFDAAVAAVDPGVCINAHLKVTDQAIHVCNTAYPLQDIEKIYVVGIGKAAAVMAQAVENILDARIHKGIVVTKYGHSLPLKYCRIIEAGHPVPDEGGVKGASQIIDLVQGATPKDLILCLISGGGSALTPLPVKGISLEDKQETTRHLLGCGATIHEINTIRKHLSGIKGGQLCRHANRARMVSMVLSDVIGDDLDMIASGITVPDSTSFEDCANILNRYSLWETLPETVSTHIRYGQAEKIPETPKPGEPEFEPVKNYIVGSLSQALAAASDKAKQLGFNTVTLSSMIQGEAAQVAGILGAIAKEVNRSGNPVPVPACILSGGETTVTINGQGKGGRNMELALACAIDLAGQPDTLLLSAGTDGTDGPTDAAGAFATGTTLERAEELDLKAQDFLARNDSYHFFKPTNDLLITGPTRTNVMDLQILLVGHLRG